MANSWARQHWQLRAQGWTALCGWRREGRPVRSARVAVREVGQLAVGGDARGSLQGVHVCTCMHVCKQVCARVQRVWGAGNICISVSIPTFLTAKEANSPVAVLLYLQGWMQ
eukprot:1160317-Pelagomonas_calceolata.AAC.13